MDKILPVPPNFTIEESLGEIAITYSWYKPTAWFLLFFCIFWDGFLFVWFALPSPIFFKAFASLHLAAGIGMTWYMLCLFFNHTKLSIGGTEFNIVNAPIYFPGYSNATVNRIEFEQVYVKENVRRGKGSITYTYELHLLTRDAQSRKLPVSFDDFGQAIFVKRKIEQFMRITPREIEGECLR